MNQKALTTTDQPRTVAEWQEAQRRQRSQISALDGQQVARRATELRAMLEVASAKIDRFGWRDMDDTVKNAICNDWCDVLSKYTLAEVKAGIAALFKASKGNLKSINEHQVEDQILKAHARQVAALPQHEPERKRERADPAKAAQMTAEVTRLAQAKGVAS